MRIILFFLALLSQSICVAEELNSLNIEFFNKFNDNYLPKYIEKGVNACRLIFPLFVNIFRRLPVGYYEFKF